MLLSISLVSFLIVMILVVVVVVMMYAGHHSTLLTQEQFVFNQSNIDTVSTTTLEDL